MVCGTIGYAVKMDEMQVEGWGRPRWSPAVMNVQQVFPGHGRRG